MSDKQFRTPKKFYSSGSSASSSSCRLCLSIGDTAYSKNIFRKSNANILAAAESLYGKCLVQDESLPQLLCRPCERRIRNFEAFRLKICETQESLAAVRAKRCIEVSPSAPRPLKKIHINERTSRRGLEFTSGEKENVNSEMYNVSTTNNLNSGNSATINFIHTKQTPNEISEHLFNIVVDKILAKINEELVKVAMRDTESALRDRGFNGMSNLKFSEIIEEMKTLCPTVYKFLSTMMEMNHNPDKKMGPLCLIYGMIMFKRCHELSMLQRVNTLLLIDGDANQEVLQRLNKLAICLDCKMKYPLLEEIGDHFMDHAIELMIKGCKYVFVLDNLDWTIKVHDMRSEVQNKSVHAVATSLVFDRVASDHLPQHGTQKNLATTDVKALVTPSEDEMACTRERYKVLLARILCEHFPAFHFLKDLVPDHTPCLYSDEMSSQSVVIPFPVLMKDEKKYSEVIDVLDSMESWVHDLSAKAGLIQPDANYALPGPPIEAPSRPGQPAAHVPPQQNDTLPKVPCYGDQLTRVRLAGAKDLRAGSHTAKDKLEHLYPFRIVDWHPKRSYLKLVFKKLYKNSAREIGTLRYFREKLQRRNVTLDVKHYEDCEQLFISVGRCYTVEALLNFFNMANRNDNPRQNRPPFHILAVGDNKQQYYNQILDKFIDEYLIPPAHEPDVDVQDDLNNHDFVRNHSLQILKFFFLIADFKDAVKEGNGLRLHQLHKQLLHHFKTDAGFNTYAIEMFITIVQNEILLSEGQAHQCIWAATTNWKGGSGKNIEIDLLQENRNKDLKKLIKGMGANKTDKAIERASKAVGGLRQIAENFDTQVSIHPTSTAHSHRSSNADEVLISNDLRQLRPFSVQAGRHHDSFPDIASDPLQAIDNDEFIKWLARHKKNLLFDAPVEEEDE